MTGIGFRAISVLGVHVIRNYGKWLTIDAWFMR
jgi:hypothetical protein